MDRKKAPVTPPTSTTNIPPDGFAYTKTIFTFSENQSGQTEIPTINWNGEEGNFRLIEQQYEEFTLDTNSGVLRWSTGLASGTYNLVILASNSAGSVSTTLRLVVEKEVKAPSGLFYTPNTYTTPHDQAGESSTPVVEWNGDLGTFSLENSTDAFFGIDAVSGRVTWNKDLKAGTHTLTIIAQNKVGAIKTRIVVTKQPKPVFPPSNFSFPTNKVNVLIHESGSSPAPLISWNGDQGTFALEEDTDGKITIDATTGIISWMSNLSPGTYTLTVTAKNSAGSIVATFTLIVGGPDISEKGEFKLYQNYPNPTNGVTYFVYNLTQSSWVRIDVYDSNGRLARNIMFDRKHEKGRHILKLNTLGYPSGVYLLRIYSAKEGHQAIKFMVVR